MSVNKPECAVAVDGRCEPAEPHAIQQHNPGVQAAAAAGKGTASPSFRGRSAALPAAAVPAQAVSVSEAGGQPCIPFPVAACRTAEEDAAGAVRQVVENCDGDLCLGKKAELCLGEERRGSASSTQAQGTALQPGTAVAGYSPVPAVELVTAAPEAGRSVSLARFHRAAHRSEKCDHLPL